MLPPRGFIFSSLVEVTFHYRYNLLALNCQSCRSSKTSKALFALSLCITKGWILIQRRVTRPHCVHSILCKHSVPNFSFFVKMFCCSFHGIPYQKHQHYDKDNKYNNDYKSFDNLGFHFREWYLWRLDCVVNYAVGSWILIYEEKNSIFMDNYIQNI